VADVRATRFESLLRVVERWYFRTTLHAPPVSSLGPTPSRGLFPLLLLIALVLLGGPALADSGPELLPEIAASAATLTQAGPGSRLRVAFDSTRTQVGIVAGAHGVRALLYNQSEPAPSGPRMTPLSLPPGGSFLGRAGNWAWDVADRSAFEIEVYDGSLAAFRVVDGRAVAAEVVDPGGLWSLYKPSKIRWGLLLWMAFLGAGLLLLARKVFALPVPPRWGVLLLVLALVPILPALSTERLFGPFDLQVATSPWRGPRPAPPFEPATPHLTDISVHLVPWQTEVRRQILAGQVPLLDQRVGAGQALLGNGQSAPFSLLSFASLPFDPPTAQALRAFLKVLLALLGAFAAARALGVRAGYALVAALAYALCGSMAVWKLHPHTEVMGLWPWFYLGTERLIRGARRGHPALLTGAALTCMLLAGHPETVAMALGVVALRWVWQWLRDGWQASRAGFARFVLATLAAVGLAAVAILPLAGTIPVSMKVAAQANEGAPWAGGHFLVSLASLIHATVPGVFGTWQAGTFRGFGAFPKISEGAVGLGVFVLAAASLPLLRWRSPRESVLPVLAAGGLALQSLPLGLDQVWLLLPVASHVAPRYAAYIAAFALALLGALALERLTTAAAGRRRRVALALGVAAGPLALAVPAIASAVAGMDGLPWWVARFRIVSGAIVAWSLAGLALPALAVLSRRRAAWVATAAAVVVTAQLALAFHGYIPTVPSAFAYPEIPLFTVLRSREPGRLIGTPGMLVPNLACVDGFDDVRAHDPTTWARYDRWLQEVLGLDRRAQIAQYVDVEPDHRAPLGALATRFLLARNGLRVPPPWRDRGLFGAVRLWELEREPQWAFFPRQVVGAGSADEAFALARGDRAPDSLVPIEAADLAPGVHEQASGAARVLGVERRATRVRVRVNTLHPAWLVVSQAAIPGWQATIDGRRTPIADADGVLVAVQVPPGGHLVELRYRPLGWRLGAPISALTAAALLFGLFRRRRRHHPPAPPPHPTRTSP